jgi:putative hydrolase of the HAD superfamily
MSELQNEKFKAIVFDHGGVIELSTGGSLMKNISDALHIPAEDFKKEYFKHNHLSNTGNIPWEDMIMEVVSAFTSKEESRDSVMSVIKEYRSKSSINTDLVALFPIIRKHGFKVAIFSNHTTSLREKLRTDGILDIVDEVVVSGEIGFQKPHKEAFDVLFEKLAVLPEEVIFIDDAPKSLEKAGEIGYTPILFKDNKQLIADLENLGIQL